MTPPPIPGAEGIILAAGTSFRAGAFKPALDLGGRPMVIRCIEGMRTACARIIVVGGFRFPMLCEMLADLGGVECIENPLFPLGMFTSVKRGLSLSASDSVFLLPVDTPLVPPHVYLSLLHRPGKIVVPTHGGRRGHPVLLRRSVIPPILGEPDSSSLRDVIHRIGPEFLEVDTPEVLRDIDTPEDYRQLCTSTE
jgi:molybdenum cofactor cytidylyltransferase